MMNKQLSIDQLVRPNIARLAPYSTARDEFSGQASVFLDANENSLGSPLPKWYHRYPDPHHKALRAKLSAIKKVEENQLFLGNGSDECIDLLYRCFCEPGKDNAIICPPTYGMYKVSADINNVAVRQAQLTADFQLDMASVEAATDENTKLIFLCSPNNPTGNLMRYADVEWLLNNFPGLVVVDEAYVNFSRQKSWSTQLADYPNLVVLQTLSKAWGLAGLRVGMTLANAEVVHYMNKAKPPYNLSQPVQTLALQALENVDQVNNMIHELVDMRAALTEVIKDIPGVQQVYPSEANFLLVKMHGAQDFFQYLQANGIIVRNRATVPGLEDCIRITIGTEQENTALIDAWSDWNDDRYGGTSPNNIAS